jgi:hypothetical protein
MQALKYNCDLFSRTAESNSISAAKRHDRSDALIEQTCENILASVERLAQKWEKANSQRVATPQLAQEPSHVVVEDAILKSFLYPTIEHRRERIAQAHARTFQWIFQDPKLHKKPWPDFTSWLRSQNEIYWINGKAASGKSTLMKHLSAQPEIQRHLSVWADKLPLVCAHFFFWNLGTTLQKSQAGLLRSLLHQTFSKHIHLIREILPDLWKEMSRRTPGFLKDLRESWHAWSVPELRQVLGDLFTLTTGSIKFCYFIDGLDEYDGDHLEIVSLLRHISSNSNVKLCISSRPLLVFEQAFDDCPKLYLQDLTGGH